MITDASDKLLEAFNAYVEAEQAKGFTADVAADFALSFCKGVATEIKSGERKTAEQIKG